MVQGTVPVGPRVWSSSTDGHLRRFSSRAPVRFSTSPLTLATRDPRGLFLVRRSVVRQGVQEHTWAVRLNGEPGSLPSEKGAKRSRVKLNGRRGAVGSAGTRLTLE